MNNSSRGRTFLRRCSDREIMQKLTCVPPVYFMQSLYCGQCVDFKCFGVKYSIIYTLFIIYIYNWCVWVLKSSTVSCLLFECYKGKIYILIIEIRLFLLSNFNAVSIGTCVVKPASDFWWSTNCPFGEHKVRSNYVELIAQFAWTVCDGVQGLWIRICK